MEQGVRDETETKWQHVWATHYAAYCAKRKILVDIIQLYITEMSSFGFLLKLNRLNTDVNIFETKAFPCFTF